MEKFGAMSTPVCRGVRRASRSAARGVRRSSPWCRRRRGCRGRRRIEVVHHRVGVVSSTATWAPASARVSSVVAPAEGGDQLQVVGGLDGPYRLGADPALGSEDGHAQLAHLVCFPHLFYGGERQATASFSRAACLSFSGPMTDSEGAAPVPRAATRARRRG